MLIRHEHDFFTFQAGVVIDGCVLARRLTLSLTHNMDANALETAQTLFQMQTVQSRVYHVEGPLSGDMPAPDQFGYVHYRNMSVHLSHIELLDENDCYLCAIASHFNELVPSVNAAVRARRNEIEIEERRHDSYSHQFTAVISDRILECAVIAVIPKGIALTVRASEIHQSVIIAGCKFSDSTFHSTHFKSKNEAEINLDTAELPVEDGVMYFLALGDTIYEYVPEPQAATIG